MGPVIRVQRDPREVWQCGECRSRPCWATAEGVSAASLASQPPLVCPCQLVGTQDGLVARFDVERGNLVSQIDTKQSTSKSYG